MDDQIASKEHSGKSPVIIWPHDEASARPQLDRPMPPAKPQPRLSAASPAAENKPDGKGKRLRRGSLPEWPRRELPAVLWPKALGAGWSVRFDHTTSENAGVAGKQALLLAVDVWPQTALPPSWPQLRLDVSGQSVSICLSPHQRWNELSQPAFAQLPVALRHSIASHVTHELRQCLGVAFHGLGLYPTAQALPLFDSESSPESAAPAPGHVTPASNMAGPVLRFTVSQIGASQPLWTAFLDGAQLVAPSVAHGAFGPLRNVRLPLHLRVATANLMRVDLQSLCVGDVVLMDASSSDEAAAMPLPFAQGLLVCATVPIGVCKLHPADDPVDQARKSWRLHGWIGDHDIRNANRSTNMNSKSDAATAQSGPPDWDQLPVQVEAALMAAPVRLGEVQRWVPGAVVPLNTSVDSDHVELRVSGQCVARGRLVAVESLLGLEIIEVYGA